MSPQKARRTNSRRSAAEVADSKGVCGRAGKEVVTDYHLVLWYVAAKDSLTIRE